jgi:hypothetical protein
MGERGGVRKESARDELIERARVSEMLALESGSGSMSGGAESAAT